jgi:hypothetical protein
VISPASDFRVVTTNSELPRGLSETLDRSELDTLGATEGVGVAPGVAVRLPNTNVAAKPAPANTNTMASAMNARKRQRLVGVELVAGAVSAAVSLLDCSSIVGGILLTKRLVFILTNLCFNHKLFVRFFWLC